MNINSQSFFFRRYLGYGPKSTWSNPHPNSICDVITRFIKRTSVYWIVLHISFATLFTLITMGPLGTWERNELGKTLYFGDHFGTVLDFLIGMPAVAGQIALLFITIIAAILGALWLLVTAIEKAWKLLPKKMTSATVEVVSDISSSIRGKSCAKVNITNLPKPNNHD